MVVNHYTLKGVKLLKDSLIMSIFDIVRRIKEFAWVKGSYGKALNDGGWVGQAKATKGLPTRLEVELTMILLYGLLLDNIYLFK